MKLKLRSIFKKEGSEQKLSKDELLSYLKVTVPDDAPDGWRVVETYDIVPNVCVVRILTNGKQYFYELIEPPLEDSAFLEELKERVLESATKYIDLPDEEALFRAFLEVTDRISKKLKKKLTLEELATYWYYLERDCLYAGKVTPFLRDEMLEDVSCAGYDKPIYVYHRIYEYVPTNVIMSEEELDSFVLAVAQKSGVELSIANPIADTVLYEGSRINVTFRKEATDHGSTFTIRKVKKEPFTPLQLIRWGSFSVEQMALLWLCVENNGSMLFVGGTAGGKTTAMNAVALFIPISSKIVSIEDTREIILPHLNWIPAIARGATTMFDLLKASLRQRPEYIIVGEVRGKEAEIMFQAMGLGHTCLSTVHGSTAHGVLDRLMGPPYNIPRQMVQNLDLIVAVGLFKVGDRLVRRCRDIHLVCEGAEVELVSRWDADRDAHRLEKEPVLERIREKTGKSVDTLLQDFERKKAILRDFVERNLDYEGLVKELHQLKGLPIRRRTPVKFTEEASAEVKT